MRFEFDWDPAKAQSNRAKHGVSFERAMAVFGDPLALSRLDDDPSAAGRLLLVVHTHIGLSSDRIAIRIISARPASRREARQYEEGLDS